MRSSRPSHFPRRSHKVSRHTYTGGHPSDAFSSAKFNVNVRAYTVDDDDLFCVNLKVDFMKKPFFKLPIWKAT